MKNGICTISKPIVQQWIKSKRVANTRGKYTEIASTQIYWGTVSVNKSLLHC